MSVLLPPAPEPVPPLDPDPSAAGLGLGVRRAATVLDRVAGWATRGGTPADWQGTASDAAGSAMTRLTGDLDDAVAALQQAASALLSFADTVEALQHRRETLVSERASLLSRHHELAATAFPDEASLRAQVDRLSADLAEHRREVDRWRTDLGAAEDAVISALRGLDTPAEAHALASARASSIDDVVASLVASGILPHDAESMSAAQLRAWLLEHPESARALLERRPSSGEGPAGELGALLLPRLVPEGAAAASEADRRASLRALFEGLSEQDARTLAMLFPAVVGNLPGVPFGYRAEANMVAVIDALAREQASLEDLRVEHERHQHDWDFLGRNNDDLEDPIADAEARVALFESILADERRIVQFDPAGDGAIVELHGDLSATTRNVGVLVPGTGTELASFQGVADRSETFVQESGGDLAMLSWLAGDLPDSVAKDAPFPSYAEDLAPRLAGFSTDLREEVAHATGSEEPVRATYLGHSYGGAVVGLAETYGLDADRVLHVESAGMGHDVQSTEDLPSSQDRVDRYSMTAPGDFIGASQGTQVGGVGHGADPDDWPGTTRLHTGDTAEGEFNTGLESHSQVFQQYSDAWYNMYEVLTGGEVMPYREPTYDYVYTGRGVVPIQSGWAPGQEVDIP